jgi:hypothetical protein
MAVIDLGAMGGRRQCGTHGPGVRSQAAFSQDVAPGSTATEPASAGLLMSGPSFSWG